MIAAGGSSEIGDEGISEVESAAAHGECGSDDRLVIDPEFPGIDKPLHELDTAWC